MRRRLRPTTEPIGNPLCTVPSSALSPPTPKANRNLRNSPRTSLPNTKIHPNIPPILPRARKTRLHLPRPIPRIDQKTLLPPIAIHRRTRLAALIPRKAHRHPFLVPRTQAHLLRMPVRRGREVGHVGARVQQLGGGAVQQRHVVVQTFEGVGRVRVAVERVLDLRDVCVGGRGVREIFTEMACPASLSSRGQ